jgi:predicted dehydrogenase
MGRRHIANARAAGLDLVAVCDTRPASLAAAQAECHLASHQLRRDAAETLNTEHPELVIVATTAPSHADLTCLAAETGARYVLCEKPMATSLAACDRMIETVGRTGTRLAINHNLRFMAQYREIKRLLDSPDLGGLTSFNMIAPNMGLAMNGTHILDLFRYFTGEAPCEVTAWLSSDIVPNPRGTEFEDHPGAIRVLTESGRRLYLEAAADQGCGVATILSARYGQIVMDDIAGTGSVVMREADGRALPTTQYTAASQRRDVQFERKDNVVASAKVLELLISGGGLPAVEDARSAVAVMVAAHVSSERGSVPVALSGAALPRSREFPWA